MERYESLGLVGEGSYGTVLKCRHRDTGQLVAIKKFIDSDSDESVRKIALREVKMLRKLHHINLVNLLEVWKRRRRWYLVFEFVERTLLDELEHNQSGLDLNTTQQYLYQILRATAFCHEQNIIHRDIKPENILVSQEGVVKLCDFGFARTIASPAEGGVYTDYVATRWYRAPELLVGDIKYGKPVDVWAVGCLLLEMLTGQPLFPGDSDLDQIYHIVRCFGHLTAHHQELFYRNPVFSGVRLPETSGQLPLQKRFPSITATALDLAQSCLQMDPERRAQCSELLEHPLFTQDSFHIRFLDELNAKIQKHHREKSTLPKITKTPRRDKDERNDKIQRGNNKKQLGDMDEKLNKEKAKQDRNEDDKMDKTKAKQLSKLSKTIQNTSEHSLSTNQSKTLGAMVTNNVASVAIKNKPGKDTGAELKNELNEIYKSSKTLTTDLTEGLKDGKVGIHGKAASSEQRQDHLKKKPKDSDSSGLHCSCLDTAVPSEKSTMDISGSSNVQPSQWFGSCSNTNTKGFSQSSTPDQPNQMESTDRRDSSLSPGLRNDHIEAPTPTITNPYNTTTTSEHQSTITSSNTYQVSDEEGSKDFECSLSAGATTSSIVEQTSKLYGISNNEQNNDNSDVESDVKASKATHSKPVNREPQAYLGSFSNHTKSTAAIILKPQKTTFPEGRKKSDNPERNDTMYTTSVVDSTFVPSRATSDHRTLTRIFVLHNEDPADCNETDVSAAPSSTLILLPPPSTPLVPSYTVGSTNSLAISDHLTLGAGLHPGNFSFRGLDKPRHQGGIYSQVAQQSPPNLLAALFTPQLSDRSLISQRSFAAGAKNKSDVHFPDLRSSVLPELRGRDGKHHKGVTKDQRRDKQPVSHLPPSEPQQHRHNSTDTHHTPKHSS